MRKLVAYLVVCCAAAGAPLVSARQPAPEVFEGWPTHFDGRPLTRLPDTPEEQRFYAEQPLLHARFSDGARIILMRWTGARLDGFHLAEECYRGFGFTLEPAYAHTGFDGRAETCFRATRAGAVHDVCEHIVDGDRRVFPDTAAWHRARFTGATRPPYLGISIIEAHALDPR